MDSNPNQKVPIPDNIHQSIPPKENFFEKNRLWIKVIVIGILVIVLQIPVAMINGLINERKQRQQDVIQEVGSKWAGSQTIGGPVITIPYMDSYKDSLGHNISFKNNINFLPEKLNIKAELFPERRNRGLFEAIVYSSIINIKGNFNEFNFSEYGIQKENLLLNEAFLSLGISDLGGIQEKINLNFNGKDLDFNGGTSSIYILKKRIYSILSMKLEDTNKTYEFNFNLQLKGSESINFIPVGKETNVSIKSKWQDPSFEGAFLPNSHVLNENGFEANYKILHYKRNFPQVWIGDDIELSSSSFGVNLIMPVDRYTKTDRTIKYSILFIALTFIMFFFIELINDKSVHPLQYILIGLAHCIFFILLLSISEHINFDWAYIISSISVLSLISLFSKSILKDFKLTLLITSVLSMIYGFIFVIIQLQDLALLMGSIGLFVVLALIMYFSRKIDFYNPKLRG